MSCCSNHVIYLQKPRDADFDDLRQVQKHNDASVTERRLLRRQAFWLLFYLLRTAEPAWLLLALDVDLILLLPPLKWRRTMLPETLWMPTACDMTWSVVVGL